jgi:hypothetical protein
MVVMKNHKQVNLKDPVLLQELDLKLNLTKVGIQPLTKTDTVVKTGGFADSNYQDYVKTLIEK